MLESPYRERNLQFLVQRLIQKLKDAYEPFECAVIVDALQPVTAGEPCSELQNRVAEALGVDLNSATDLASIVSNSLFSMRKSLEGVMLKV